MIFLVPVLCLAVFTVLLGIVWSRLDDKSVIAITSVLAGGLAGLIGAFLSSVISHRRSEQESEDRLKKYASTQALELTKLEFDLRRETKRQNQLLAPAMDGRYLRVILLPDGETVHNAFFDRTFTP
jgi:hypothetical protein